MSSKSLINNPALEAYIAGHSARERDILRRLREETAAHPQAIMQIAPEQGELFGILVRATRARQALEIGVFTGYSSLAVALALPPEGRLIACDISEEYTTIARRYWREAGVDLKIDLRLAPAEKTLNSLIAEGRTGSFDFVFIDADKTGYDRYYELCLRLLRANGLMAIDNTLQSGAVADPANNEENTLAIRALNDKISKDDRVFATLLPLADGVTLAVKR